MTAASLLLENYLFEERRGDQSFLSPVVGNGMDVAHVPVLDVSPAVLKSLQFLFFFLSPGFSRSM